MENKRGEKSLGVDKYEWCECVYVWCVNAKSECERESWDEREIWLVSCPHECQTVLEVPLDLKAKGAAGQI